VRDLARSRRGQEGATNELLAAGDLGLSVQVLQEFYVQATRASRADAITHEQATGLVEAWRRFPVQDLAVEVMVSGGPGMHVTDAEAASRTRYRCVARQGVHPMHESAGIRR
jgi:hypothetical protein